MFKYFLLIIVSASMILTGCKGSETISETIDTTDVKASVRIFPLDNKMMYETKDAEAVQAIARNFENKAPVLEKMLPRYTHRVVITRGEKQTTWLFNKVGYIQEDKSNARIFRLSRPELVTKIMAK